MTWKPVPANSQVEKGGFKVLQSGLKRKCVRAFLLASLGIVSIPRVAVSASYTFVDMYTIFPGAGYTGLMFADTYVSSGGSIGAAATKANPIPAGEGPNHAMYWSGAGVPTDIHPSGYFRSQLNGISASGQKVGYVEPIDTQRPHAAMWDAANSFLDLHPGSYYSSTVHGTDGQSQVGYARLTSGAAVHAMVWHGTNVGTDLNPDGFDTSTGFGVFGSQQVGYGSGTVTNNLTHALLWNGTNAAIDLNPVGSLTSRAWATDGTQQVGYGSAVAGDGINTRHALLWNGSNDAIDLNPAGMATSQALGVLDGKQVGFAGDTYLTGRAMLWSGSNVPVDLGALAPNTFQSTAAYSIDAAGNVYGFALDTSQSQFSPVYHVVKWVVAPEPGTLMLLASSATICMVRRKREALA
jgi:hypothetical protein